jgi:hypothetical protein
MNTGRLFALVAGILFLGLGLTSFVPSLVESAVAIPNGVANFGAIGAYRYLLGIFPVNTAEAVLYLTFGALGVASAAALDSSRLYAGFTAVIFGTLTILGLIPLADTVFGLFPVFGSDVWLHAAIAAVAAYFGFFATPGLMELWQAK